MLTRALSRDVFAGAVGAIVTLAGWLTLALLPYASLGAAGAEAGIPAACAAVAVGGLVVALLGRSAMPVGGLSSATVLIFAAAVAGLARDPRMRWDEPGQVALLVAAMSFCVVLAGALQVLFGVLRLGSLAKYVPQPVLAGFMNSVALLVLIAQLPMLLGLAAPAWGSLPAVLAGLQPATLAVGIATAAAVWTVARRWPRAPATLLGLLFGCALYAALRTGSAELSLGPLIGAVPVRPPLPTALAPLLEGGAGGELLAGHARSLIVTALLLAIVGSLETVLNALATDRQLHARHDPNRELIAFGAGNVASGVFGGLPVVYWRTGAVALLANGALSRRAIVVCALATGALFVAGGPLIALLPVTVLAGIMLTVAWGLVDRWSRGLVRRAVAGDRSRELWLDLALVAVVFAATLGWGFVAGVALGVLLALGMFIHSMNRSLVRSRYDGAAQPSRRVYARAQESFLHEARRRIAVLELEGALFFGNADRLAVQVEDLDAGYRFVVLDLRRISTLDPSGAAVLAQLATRLAQTGCILLLAGVSEDNRNGRVLRAFGASRRGAAAGGQEHWFVDTDRAVEFAEQRLLAEAGLGVTGAEHALDDCALLQGLDAAQRARLRALLQPRRLQPRELLFRQGDPGDHLYVLTQGSITVQSPGSAGHRYVSFSPGMMLGETAMLDGGGRTADAVADVPTQVHALSRDALIRLADDDPELARLLMTNIAVHLSERLRQAAAAWRVAAA